ncbi:MAG TPA: formate/nitrite transporter family protein [Tepidisphaeraceae bacterium]|nr:formate/nitrite transporter family protein [Tepidisphaeraceae bacterium]
MYADAIAAMGDQAATKLREQKKSLLGHIIRSMLAGMYVGAAIVLIFTIGAFLSKDSPGLVKLVMGVCFGGALTIVIFAGSELFTGSNLVLTLGVLTRKSTPKDLLTNWVWTWVGNLLGSMLLAVMVFRSGVISADPVKSFILKVTETKMNLPAEQLIWRAILANWMVCLGVWMATRVKSETGKIIMIWWCMFTFITCAYEHSIANMTALTMGLLLPHEGIAGITLNGFAYNLALATLGNIVGGAFFVGGLYWLGSPAAREAAAAVPELSPAIEPDALAGVSMAPQAG